MNKVTKRLLVFFIGVPIVIGIVALYFYNHIALNILAVVASAFGANEMYNMASNKVKMFPKTLVIIFLFQSFKIEIIYEITTASFEGGCLLTFHKEYCQKLYCCPLFAVISVGNK